MSKIIFQGYDDFKIVDVDTGFITRSRGGKIIVEGSKNWTVTTIFMLLPFNNKSMVNVKEFYKIIVENKESLFYKNGNPRFEVGDYDHGTHRVWGDKFKKHQVNIG